MAKFTFYCRVDRDNPRRGIKAGVYSYGSEHDHRYMGWNQSSKAYSLISSSGKVWRQGPLGGVKIIKNRNFDVDDCGYGYVTTNEEQMKEFVWIKLQARAV